MSTPPPAPLEHLDLPIVGMTCASCAMRIEKRLNRLDGVLASVNYATEQASIDYAPDKSAPAELVAAIERAGYTAPLPPRESGAPRAARPPGTRPRVRLIVAAAASLPLLLLGMIPALQFDNWQWLSLQLATPVLFWAGWPFHRAAWTNLRHGTASMDTLISIGTIAAWSWSVVSLFFLGAGDPGMRHELSFVPERGGPAGDVYFEVVGVVITFMLAGRTFEARAKRRAGAALRALIALGAKDAALLRPDGSEQRVPVQRLRVGDRFVVRPGEKIATDGEVVEGSSAVDRSLLTGESVPVEVSPGDEVDGRDGQRRRADRRARDARRLGHRARPDRRARHARAVGQGARPAPRRPRRGGVRAGRDRDLRRDARLLDRRGRDRRRVRRGGRRC